MRKFLMQFVMVALILMLANVGFTKPKIEGRTVEYSAQGVLMKGYLAYDENIKGKRPGVLVELGYIALAVDMYGDGRQAMHPNEAGKFSSELMKNFDVAKTRFIAAMDFLKQQPTVDPNRMAAIGYCFGGGVVLNMARQGVDLRGVVSFHGSLAAVKPAQPGSVKAKILVLNGDADKFTTPEQIEAFKREMKAAGVDFQFISYPGALHSFTNPEADEYGKKFNLPLAYNADADRKSWNELKKFLSSIFRK
jgi:dienelactone hydrolase